MATYTLTPNDDAAPDSGDWTVSDGGTIHAALEAAGGATITTGATGKDFRVDFTTQALGVGETIDSVQACITGHMFDTRSETADVRIDIEDGDNSNSDYFTDTHTVTENGGSAATYCSDVETTSDGGSTAWTQADIDDIRMMGEVTSFSGGGPSCRLYQAYITVITSIPAAPTTYTSDDQVTLSGGTLEFKNGMTVIGSKN